MNVWLSQTTGELHQATGDDGWLYLGMHDLRRTWATSLASNDVDPLLVIDWGGWNELGRFLEHYRGTHSPEDQQRARGKVTWL
ncbi:hypothetical protein ACLI4Q_17395 [Natrialbaceae archaeon A-CW1-1]